MLQEGQAKLESYMEYAIRLADPEFHGEWEDVYKLACLVDNIAKFQRNGVTANPELEREFCSALKRAYRANGVFRHELEAFPDAKCLITGA
jgi:hypothetical protein